VFRQRISDEGIATIANMLDALDGYEKNGVTLDTTTETVTDDGTVQRDTVAVVRFFKLGLVDQLFHTVASPPVTYLLLLIGLALLVFEFFTAGVGIAGVVGAGSLILACYGLAELPARAWAVALLVLAMVAFAIDVQVGLPRLWTGDRDRAHRRRQLVLFEPILGGSSLRPGVDRLIAGIGGIMLTFIVGMPSMVRTRFATPTIGREWMIGEVGTVVERVGPDGVVRSATPLAGPHQPRDPGRGRRPGSCRRHRRRDARGRAARRRRQGLPRDAEPRRRRTRKGSCGNRSQHVP
jgi:membrane-bound serine protease (ClpP class)